ncbi:unnamed protein product [Spirodela intermedia]|uniref:cysteine dioxygenase n=1 Tax=Spirodela intermedia TaxID=51605 RepID=A0A7I8J7M4_SPIIN|nr:unnamed protein product [Spirodela intermedia]CAA6666207.1 unnamed protein product [Spirodela intermedia]
MPTLVQKLFNTCREIFSGVQAGVVPSPAGVERLRSVLDRMNPGDVGLNQSMPYFGSFGETEKPPPVTYLHLYECEQFSIGIFCLPPSAVIPLHNHPGMTVFSKLLFGSMHVKSFDWLDGPPPDTEPGLAKVVMDAAFTAPCNTTILYPAAGGNIHCFTAVTACAVWTCSGLRTPTTARTTTSCPAQISPPGRVWLEQREKKPDDFVVVGGKYRGPRIVVR